MQHKSKAKDEWWGLDQSILYNRKLEIIIRKKTYTFSIKGKTHVASKKEKENQPK